MRCSALFSVAGPTPRKRSFASREARKANYCRTHVFWCHPAPSPREGGGGGGLREACPAGAGDSIGRRSDGPATKIIIISTELFFLSSVQRCSCSLGGGFFFFFCCLHARSSGCNADVRVASSAASIGSGNLRM